VKTLIYGEGKPDFRIKNIMENAQVLGSLLSGWGLISDETRRLMEPGKFFCSTQEPKGKTRYPYCYYFGIFRKSKTFHIQIISGFFPTQAIIARSSKLYGIQHSFFRLVERLVRREAYSRLW
jgi:hypothetical protein